MYLQLWLGLGVGLGLAAYYAQFTVITIVSTCSYVQLQFTVITIVSTCSYVQLRHFKIKCYQR